MRPIDLVIETALSCLNVHGRWGGNHPLEGFDCSGLVQWILKSAGVDPVGDQTAQGLYAYFDRYGWNSEAQTSEAGTLLFYSSTKEVDSITHVSMLLSPYQIIEAGGVHPGITTPELAAQAGSMVRLRHVSHRGTEIVSRIRPFYTSIGLAT